MKSLIDAATSAAVTVKELQSSTVALRKEARRQQKELRAAHAREEAEKQARAVAEALEAEEKAKAEEEAKRLAKEAREAKEAAKAQEKADFEAKIAERRAAQAAGSFNAKSQWKAAGNSVLLANVLKMKDKQ